MKINEVTYNWAGTLTKRAATRRIILHHAAAVSCTAQQIHAWHLANGWAGIGYHFLVRKDGSVYRGRPEDTTGAHAGNHNYDSIGVCFEGSFDKEEMGEVQRQAGAALVAYLKEKYGITTVQKHSDVNATGCPGSGFPFDAIAYGTAEDKSEPSAEDTGGRSGVQVTLPLLAQGSQDGTVQTVQAALNGLGFDAGTADGIFGSNTAAAVKRFQVGSGLVADGIVGRDTWHRLLRV